MQDLPDDMNYYLIQNFINSYKDLYLFIQLNRYYNRLSIEKFKNKLGFLRYITQNIPKYILTIFKDISDFGELPLMHINSYQDIYEIRANQLKNVIVRGMDLLGKKFILFKFSFEKENEERKEVVLSLYQEYICYYTSISHWKFVYNSENEYYFKILSKLNIRDGKLFNERSSLKKLIRGEKLYTSDYEISL